MTLSQLRGAKTLKGTYTAEAVWSFHDSSATAYWNPAIPYNSVKTAGSGIKLDITGFSADRTTYQVRVHR